MRTGNSCSLGVGGKGVFDSRPHDQFGWGYYYIHVDNPTIQGPLQTASDLRNEYGFEWYYNFAITPWAMLTPDIQVVRGAQKDRVTIGHDAFGLPTLNKKSVGTATVLGIRLQLVF